MEIPLSHVDVFSGRVFAGNPAAVCPLSAWLPDATLQAIAAENHLPTTAFVAPLQRGYELRWFSPTTEFSPCGHATLASGLVVSSFLAPGISPVRFQTQAGRLEVMRADEGALAGVVIGAIHGGIRNPLDSAPRRPYS